jgi:hypothetical protein
MVKTSTVKLPVELINRLKGLKHPGQSIGGVIEELLNTNTSSLSLIEQLKLEKDLLKNEVNKYKDREHYGESKDEN